MALRKGLPAKLALTDADDTRYDFRNLVVCNADGSPRGGVTSPVGVSLVSSTATMNVSVGAFSAIAARDGGAILLANDGPTNVLLPAAPASNSRIDVIWAKQNDASSTVVVPDANNNALLSSTQGTASATPTKPAIPTGAVELATVLIPSGATATNSSSPAVVITQTAQFTAAPGAAVPIRTLADLQAWATPQPFQQAQVFKDSAGPNNGTYFWNSTLTVPVWQAKPLSGLVPIIPSSVSGATAPTIDANGKITFTVAQAASAIGVNGVFSNAFTRYKVMITTYGVNDPSVGTGTTNTDMYVHFSTNGSQNTGNSYYGGANASPATVWQLGGNGGHGRTLEWTIFNPFQPLTTKSFMTGMVWDSGNASFVSVNRAFGYAATTAFDGFQVDFQLPSGRAAGEIQIFGYLD